MEIKCISRVQEEEILKLQRAPWLGLWQFWQKVPKRSRVALSPFLGVTERVCKEKVNKTQHNPKTKKSTPA